MERAENMFYILSRNVSFLFQCHLSLLLQQHTMKIKRAIPEAVACVRIDRPSWGCNMLGEETETDRKLSHQATQTKIDCRFV